MDAGISGGIFAFFGFDDAGIVAKDRFEFVVGLFAQFVAVTQKQGGFGQLPGLAASARADWRR